MTTRFSFAPETVPDDRRPALLDSLGLNVADRAVLIGTLVPDRLRGHSVGASRHDPDFAHRLRDRLHHINELAHDRGERLRLDVRCAPVEDIVGMKRCYLVGRGDMALALALGAFSMSTIEATENAADLDVAGHDRECDATTEVFIALRALVGEMRDTGRLRTCPDSIAEMHAVHYGAARHFALLHEREFDVAELNEAIARARAHRYPVEHGRRQAAPRPRHRTTREAPSL